MKPDIPTILRLDAVANGAGGIALLTTAGALSVPLGYATSTSLRVVGVALLVYAAEHLLVARRPTRANLAALALGDVVFGIVVLTLAAANPSGAETWARWTLVVVADLALIMAALKWRGRGQLHSMVSTTRASQPAI